jgi:hypothetical protein
VELRHCSQDAPPIYREDTFPAARAFRLSTARGEITELSTSRDRGEDWSPPYRRGFLASRQDFFPLTALGAKITASSAKTEMDASPNPFSPASLA